MAEYRTHCCVRLRSVLRLPQLDPMVARSFVHFQLTAIALCNACCIVSGVDGPQVDAWLQWAAQLSSEQAAVAA